MSLFDEIAFDGLDLFEDESYLDCLLLYEKSNGTEAPIEEYEPLGKNTLYCTITC
jgi:hypothetical protein